MDQGPRESKESAAIRVLVIDDTRVCREGLASLLRLEGCFSAVETSGPGGEALVSIRDLGPDVVLLNASVSGRIATVGNIMAALPGTKIIAIGVSETDEDVTAYAEAGVAGYFSREGSVADLSASIQTVARGETICSPRVAARLFRRVAALSAGWEYETARERLSHRELEIIQLIGQGLSNKEIAQRLFIDACTVKNHVHNLLQKLRVRRRWQAVAKLKGLHESHFASTGSTRPD